MALSRQILFFRAAARSARRPEHGWRAQLQRNDVQIPVSVEQFCMQNWSVDPAVPPAGYRGRSGERGN